jgi:hypothetical protein
LEAEGGIDQSDRMAQLGKLPGRRQTDDAGRGALESGIDGDGGALIGNSVANGDAGSSTSGVARTG